MIKYFLSFLGLLFSLAGQTQVGKQLSSGEIYNELKKLANPYTVMYVAAHPDDENTRLISYLSNYLHVNTIYLSLTRGGGGQNLIGTEKGHLLGVLRTQELLAARKIDGGKQWFTRAVDFGYSKSVEETLRFWGKDEVLGDVVWAIRKHRPDVIITRFDPNSNRRTHGHHTASAQLAMEAFDLAGDKNAYPEQLKHVETWQPERIYFNTSWWFYGSRENFEKADKSNMAEMDVGVYYPVLGRSNNEIAALSRSQHRCQGFGSAASRGSQMEYLLHLKGSKPEDKNDILGGIDGNNSYSKFNDEKISALISNFDFLNPQKTARSLLHIKKELMSEPLKNKFSLRKIEHINRLIPQVLGLYVESAVSTPFGSNQDSILVQTEIINRSTEKISLLSGEEKKELLPNQRITLQQKQLFSHSGAGSQFNDPYWLRQPVEGAWYQVPETYVVGSPDNLPLWNNLEFESNKTNFNINPSIQYKRVEPDYGEIYEPFRIVPKVSVALDAPVYLARGGENVQVNATVKAYSNDAAGYITLSAPKGWEVDGEYKFNMDLAGETETFSFTLKPKRNAESGSIAAYTSNSYNEKYQELIEIDYDHIPSQIVLQPSESKLQVLDIEIPELKVAYIEGAGDDVAESLANIGIDVTPLHVSDIDVESLKQFDAVVLGIRAFNTQDDLKYATKDLWSYVHQGGNVLVQYNTSRGLGEIAPLPLTLGRDRISEEDAELSFIAPEHKALNYPNKISQADFSNWVQERGLYFASEWDDAFRPLLRGHDKGENDKDGALLVAEYGEGYYTYTGLSFFRELPAGVPGAYRLIVNLLSLAK